MKSTSASSDKTMARYTIIIAGFVLAVLLTLALVQTVRADTITFTLEFTTTVHGRPVQVVITRHESVLDDSAEGPDAPSITWECEVIELDAGTTPTVQPTIQPTVTQSPGQTITPVPTSSPGPAGPYVASSGGTKFHLPTCSHAQRILPANLVTFATRQEALDAGYSPCSVCKP